ncbi:MAG: class I SAM-dependent rRNA methyltransferase [Rhodospirillales bacterium]|jgi:23S rRNA (cytosine1962-C5)-methyltransferase|nr:class I SAM-dependent rRNA methyltransferase [Rhodospirillales bacterium]MDP6884485.1 class I SAM-dependent rRNA methyltransferase [Rhodospirillales bacterium]
MTAESVLPSVFLMPGGDRRLGAGHPWVYSNEIRMDPDAKALAPGAVVVLRRVDGKRLGLGTFNARALIAFRLFAADPTTVVDKDFFSQRLGRALALRQRLYAEPYYRLIHGEADGLPGLVADRFADVLVLQIATAGMEALLEPLLAAVDAVVAPDAVVLRGDGAFRALENLDRSVSVAKGHVKAPVMVRESDLAFPADLLEGQKTGWFFDQRDNRAFVAGLARGGRMLDVFCHSAAFGVGAAGRGATDVIGIDSSEKALQLGRQAARLNGVEDRCRFLHGDAFRHLEELDGAGERFQVVAADPPAFVKSKKDLKAGLRGYRKLARLAARLVAPGGFLFMASCSYNAEAGLFAKEVATGMRGAGRTGRVIRSAGAGPDHPVHPFLAESAYLKTLVLHLD